MNNRRQKKGQGVEIEVQCANAILHVHYSIHQVIRVSSVKSTCHHHGGDPQSKLPNYPVHFSILLNYINKNLPFRPPPVCLFVSLLWFSHFLGAAFFFCFSEIPSQRLFLSLHTFSSFLFQVWICAKVVSSTQHFLSLTFNSVETYSVYTAVEFSFLWLNSGG